MRTFGWSALTVFALAAPAWGSYPPPDGPPAPGGYPVPGLQPSGFAVPPDVLPPLAPSPVAPKAGAPAAGPDPNGFAFDPYDSAQRPRRSLVHEEAWARVDWLSWNFRNAPVPPLIVTGNPNLPGAGLAGSGNVSPLVGPSRDLGRFNGFRVTVGQWFDPDGELGGELSGFIFGREGSADFFQGSAARPLSVPVLGTNGAVGVYDFSFPGRFAGTLGVRTASQLYSGEANVLHRFYGDGCVSIDGLFGYRYLQLNERLDLLGRAQSVGAIATFQGAPLPGGAVVLTSDSFRARTEFHGAQIGLRGEVRRDMFTVTAFAKGGAGANVQTLRVDGSTRVPGVGATGGGLRALPTNLGRDTNTEFSLTGDTGLELGFQVTKHVSLRVGYNLLWWSDVLRPGAVISPLVTLSQVPIDPTFSAGAAATRPVTVFRTSDFLAHGLVVGAVIDW